MRALSRLLFVSCLAMAGAAAAQTASQTASQPGPVEVDLWSFKFDPDVVTLKAGQPYVLHLVNRSDSPHDFEAKAFFAAAHVQPQDGVTGGKVEIAPNASRDVHIVAPAAGSYDVRCTHFGHAMLGMKAKIAVE